MEYCYLLQVNLGVNANKFYCMEANGDGTFTATYGRVNKTTQTTRYPMSKWNSIYNSKLKKGYKDTTTYRAVGNGPVSDAIEHESLTVRTIFSDLKRASNKSFADNYMSNIGVVTQTMIDDSQAELNRLADELDSGQWQQFNNTLVRLFHIIPRKMDGKVADYVLPLDRPSSDKAKELLTNEQSLLDMVRGQVFTNQTEQTNLFDLLNLTVDECTLDEINMIKGKLGEVKDRFDSAIKLTHPPTLTRFEVNNQVLTPNLRLDWHGSRTENWISILATGLVLYPTSAKRTGSMFGSGLYIAPKARKSVGYTSIQNSYWAKGNQNYGYLALFHTNLGSQWDITRSGNYSHLDYNKVKAQGFDSVYAHANPGFLQNDEIIIYSEAQCTVGFLVRIK